MNNSGYICFAAMNMNKQGLPSASENNQGPPPKMNNLSAPFEMNNCHGSPFNTISNPGEVLSLQKNNQNNNQGNDQDNNIRQPQVFTLQNGSLPAHGDASLFIKERLSRMIHLANPQISNPKMDEEIRLNKALAATFQNYNAARAAPPPPPQPASSALITAANLGPATGPHAKSVILDDLAIGRLQKSQVGFDSDASKSDEQAYKAYSEDLKQRGCHFCNSGCDYGVSDGKVFLHRDESDGFCVTCDPEQSEFYELWRDLSINRKLAGFTGTKENQMETLHTLNNLPNASAVASDAEPSHRGGNDSQTFSKIDGMDITRYMRPQFCQSCPWLQVDVSKARICTECRREKLTVVAHGCHAKFLPIYIIDAADFKPASVPFNEGYRDLQAWDGAVDATWAQRNGSDKRCMICANHAVSICADCPLKLCATCEVVLKWECKGWLDQLFYHYERTHIRNDAFLLRSDGGGF